MFGDVSKFVQADYFAAHPSGSLILPDAAYEIELFVCLEADAYDAEIYAVERYTADTAALLDAVQARAVNLRWGRDERSCGAAGTAAPGNFG